MTFRERVLQAATAQRPAGRSLDAGDELAPAVAFERAVDAMAEVLDALSDDEWQRPAHGDIGMVRDLVAHLVAVEEIAAGWVTSVDEPAVSEHLESTAWAREAFAGRAGDELAAVWRTAADRFAAVCAGADHSKPVLAHDLPTDVDGLLVLRTFEVWAHRLDVCRAVGRRPEPTDRGQLTLMSSRLAGAIPFALALRDVAPPARSLRLVLTGPGGGCHDVDLGGDGPDLDVIADTEDVCRVAARRLAPDALDLVVRAGDHSDARLIAESLDAFARD